MLAANVLEEVPTQIVDYMTRNKIKPGEVKKNVVMQKID